VCVCVCVALGGEVESPALGGEVVAPTLSEEWFANEALLELRGRFKALIADNRFLSMIRDDFPHSPYRRSMLAEMKLVVMNCTNEVMNLMEANGYDFDAIYPE
jgi:hypothetical protein